MPCQTGSDICYVLMPFGPKANPFPGPKGPREIDFDQVYEKLIVPAITNAGLRPFRSDKEFTSGLILSPIFERLLLCKYAIADLTTANPNVYYELGIRHTARPWSTVLLHGDTVRLPFDIQDLRAQKYSLDDRGCLTDVESEIERLTVLLNRINRLLSKFLKIARFLPYCGNKGTRVPILRR
jgi:hypothetical protein